MKIAFAYDVAYPWHVGGIEAINYMEAKELAKEHEVHFFTLRWPGMKRRQTKDRIMYHTFHNVSQEKLYRHGRRSVREAAFYALGLLRVFGKRFDVVVTDQFPMLHLPVLKLYRALSGSKLVVQVAEVWSRDYWKNYLGAFGSIAYSFSMMAIRGADHYIANSSDTARVLQGIGIDEGRITVFSPVLDSEETKAARQKFKQMDYKQVIFSGRLIKEKRVDKLLAALASAAKKEPAIKAIIIGKGPEQSRIERIVHDRRLANNVKIVGFFKNKAEFYKEIMESSVMLHMSEREGLGIVAIESIALGTPVLLPDYSPMPTEVKDMCMVVKEREIPTMLVSMVRSSEKASFIKNVQNLDMFSTSRIVEVFSDIFHKMEANNGSA
ncbi:MAG: glycosyltransferase family 4 protein [Candidatus Micrarchaeota archaeon]|nr:glycosyltransferase family 4 protein [Candidatus Micrarchaeota archaeon]MDE1824236.1 glycosyltransferase family 4 protein [Candidatus Micrarchaeota archaeon]MDE1849377.1 glycosyltransferase family 4 protein [Candidatus Micrarchaeota archaeon]